MNDTTKHEQETVLQQDMNELKQEMRQAKQLAWLEKNKNNLLIALISLLIIILASAFWSDHRQTQKEQAALLYNQALEASSLDARKALLATVIKDHSDTAYAFLAAMQLASSDKEHADVHLQEVINHPQASPEIRWQAQLDLAQWYHAQGKDQAAKESLQKSVGKDYQQVRYALLAELTKDAAEKKDYLQKAAKAVSHDPELQSRIHTLLAGLTTE